MSQEPQWFTELNEPEGMAFSLEHTKKLHDEHSDFQHIEVYDTHTFGKLMVIDGCTMVSQRDNFVYHEMLSHPALFSHPAPKNVAIIGGGDCGTLREVLKHPEVESVVQIDIDELVTRISERYFPELCESNDDPRAQLKFIDGLQWMKAQASDSLDIIIVDSTDPAGPGEVLFTQEFFHDCFRALHPDGIFVQQSESPLLHGESIIKPMHENLRAVGFSAIETLQFPAVIYPSGWWSATMASKSKELSFIREHISRKQLFPTSFYNADIHKGSLAIPEFLRKILST